MTRRLLALGGFRIHALDLGRFTVSRRDMFRAGESAPRHPAASAMSATTRSSLTTESTGAGALACTPAPAGAPGFARGSTSAPKARPLTLPPGPDRVVLAMNALLVETERARVLIETGVGTKLSPAASRLQDLAPGPGLDAALADIGFSSEDVDFVINTHLHFDHCGGNTEHGPDGIVRPAFPNAVYVIPNGEWDAAFDPPSRDRESYERPDFEPLAASGRLRLVEGQVAVAEGIRVFPTPGHTAHHQCVTIASEGRTLCFLGDLVPTAAHAGFSFVMSYDLNPGLSLKTKRALYDRALPEGWLFALAHDPAHVFGTIVRDGTRFEFRPLSREGSGLNI